MILQEIVLQSSTAKVLLMCTILNSQSVILQEFVLHVQRSTAIDLILVWDSDKISQPGVIHTSFRDHSSIFCTRKVVESAIGSHNTVTL